MNYIKPDLEYAFSLRRAFVNKFVDKSVCTYRDTMGHGDFYGTVSHRTCIWESFKSYNVISRSVALRIVSELPEVYVTWDNSPSNISRKLQKSRLISLSGAELVRLLTEPCGFRREIIYRPSDFYVFDRDLSFHVTFTHRYIKGIGNICLTSRFDLAETGISPAFNELFECTRNKI